MKTVAFPPFEARVDGVEGRVAEVDALVVRQERRPAGGVLVVERVRHFVPAAGGVGEGEGGRPRSRSGWGAREVRAAA